FRLTEARRQAVSIRVSARCSAWDGLRTARIVDLSATGARIEGLAAPEGSELRLTFKDESGLMAHRRAHVKRSADSASGPWVGIAFVASSETSRTLRPEPIAEESDRFRRLGQSPAMRLTSDPR